MRFIAQQGRLSIHLRVFRQGRDLQVLCGGGATHVGAVALAAPAHAQTEAQSHLAGLPGHKEGALALRMAQRMAQAMGCTVCVSAGIHYENITREEIRQVEQMAHDLTERCISALAKDSPCSR